MFLRFPIMHAEPGAGGAAPTEPRLPVDPPNDPGDGDDAPSHDDPGDEARSADPADPKAADPKPADDKPKPPTWPENWRQIMARGDEKLEKRLSRFAAPTDVWESYANLERKMAQGVKDSWTPPKDADDAALAKWREERGIPAEAKDYAGALGDLVIGEEDEPMAASFFDAAHEANMPPGVMKSALEWYYRQQEEHQAKYLEQIQEAKQKAEDELRDEWGPEYRANLTQIAALFDLSGAEGKEALQNAVSNTGIPLMQDPRALRFLRQVAGLVNPAGTLVPTGGTNDLQSVNERISEIEKMMRTSRKEYNRNAAVQQEYRDLLDARSRFAGR